MIRNPNPYLGYDFLSNPSYSLRHHRNYPPSAFHRSVLSARPLTNGKPGLSMYKRDNQFGASNWETIGNPLPLASPSLMPSAVQTKLDTDIFAAVRRTRAMPGCASDGSRATSFIMVFMGHSGSSAILSELRSHPDVYVDVMELVDHQKTFNTTEALVMTRQFFEKGVRLGKVPGFKIRPHHILAEPTEFRKLFKDFNTRVIWQYRQNLFKASIGEYAVRYLNDDRSVEGLRQNLSDDARCQHPNGCSFRVENITYLHQILKGKIFSHNLISKAIHEVGLSVASTSTSTELMEKEQPCIRELPYEDYLYDRAETIRDIFKFLGLPWRATLPSRFKATLDNLCKVVKNWDEVCRFFYPCIPWQQMLNDRRNQCFCPTIAGPTTFCQVYDFL